MWFNNFVESRTEPGARQYSCPSWLYVVNSGPLPSLVGRAGAVGRRARLIGAITLGPIVKGLFAVKRGNERPDGKRRVATGLEARNLPGWVRGGCRVGRSACRRAGPGRGFRVPHA